MIPRSRPENIADLVPIELQIFKMSPVDLSPVHLNIPEKHEEKTIYGPLPTDFFRAIKPRKDSDPRHTQKSTSLTPKDKRNAPRAASELFEECSLNPMVGSSGFGSSSSDFDSMQLTPKTPEFLQTPPSRPERAKLLTRNIPEVVVTPPPDSNPIFGSTRTINNCCTNEKSSWSSLFSCWKPQFPKGLNMKCSCMNSASSYERLPHVSSYLELDSIYSGDIEDKDSSTEKQEELIFYNDDNSYQTVVVEKNLCVSDLCQLLALKNRVAKDVNWTIVEHWIDLGLERSLEDNEDVLAVYQSMEGFSKRSVKKFVFRKDFIKYEFFQNPQQFFPNSMIDLGDMEECSLNANKTYVLQSMLLSADECPLVFSLVWVRDANKQVWSKGYLVLKDRKLYLSFKVQVIKKLLRGYRGNSSSAESSPSSSLSSSPNFRIRHEEAEVFADLSEYQVYRTLNAKNQLRAPTEFGICLRPTRTTVLGEGSDAPLAALKCLACESERARLCWITAMRLAKYGKQLRENYRSFRNKHLENMSPKDYNSFILPNDNVKSRVAMDFTGSQGRIVDDPKEAKAIAVAEGYSWKRRWRPVIRQTSGKMAPSKGTQNGVHVSQPWFHSGLSRDSAAALVAKHGTYDGVFLVRESQSNPGAFVLTMKVGSKVLHKEISPVPDVLTDGVCYSLDGGQTKFYDLVQLVEFHLLNAGTLTTRLTHYVVEGVSTGARRPIGRLPTPNAC